MMQRDKEWIAKAMTQKFPGGKFMRLGISPLISAKLSVGVSPLISAKPSSVGVPKTCRGRGLIQNGRQWQKGGDRGHCGVMPWFLHGVKCRKPCIVWQKIKKMEVTWCGLNVKQFGKVRVIICENIFAIVVPVDLSSNVLGNR